MEPGESSGVGVDVSTAERVDRLLGVTHDHEPAGQRPRRPVMRIGRDQAHKLPLDGVGVLELVDQDERELGVQ